MLTVATMKSLWGSPTWLPGLKERKQRNMKIWKIYLSEEIWQPSRRRQPMNPAGKPAWLLTKDRWQSLEVGMTGKPAWLLTKYRWQSLKAGMTGKLTWLLTKDR